MIDDVFPAVEFGLDLLDLIGAADLVLGLGRGWKAPRGPRPPVVF